MSREISAKWVDAFPVERRQMLFNRRHVLHVGGFGPLGLSLPALFRAEARAAETPDRPKATAKSVIFLFQWGGPSHLETFDMKPDAPQQIRGEWSPIQSNVPGMPVCELLPNVAKVMDKVTLVKSVYHTMKNHNSAAYTALSGREPPIDDIRLRDSLDLFPAYGSVVSSLTPAAAGLPTFAALPHVISDGSITPGQHASFLGKEHDAMVVTQDPNAADFRLPELSLPANVSPDRLARRVAMQKLVDDQSRMLENYAEARGVGAYYDKALAMLASPKVRNAFDLSQESNATRDRYGRTTYGQSCLLARRLVEAGVKFVNVYFSNSIGGQSTTSGGWDTHGFNNTHMFPILKAYQLPIADQTLPALLNDLDERGLLDETLVVWMGEFGRTPKLNDQASRDHWPQCYTALLAGGGMKRGFVHGASDRNGAYPDRDPMRIEELAATMFTALGISPDQEVRDSANRPLVVAPGKARRELFA